MSSVVAAAAARLGAQPRKGKGKAGPIPPQRQRYVIHPAVGVARIGNSPDSFYLEPRTIGGMPIECDAGGNPRTGTDGRPVYVASFKKDGRIRRQAAQFAVYLEDSSDPSGRTGREITLDDPDVESIEWTVHLANKKSVWYNNDELIGNVMLADPANHNYYQQGDVHNPEVENRRKLIIDPGPRSISTPGTTVPISKDNVPKDYPHASFPDPDTFAASTSEPARRFAPYRVETLGDLKMDSKGRLLVLGGHGRVGGLEPAVTYTGADTWFDDNSDGPVSCILKLKGRDPIRLTAWALVGSPKYAPELRNISNLDDVMFDVAVRYQKLVPEMYAGGGFRQTYRANYERDIRPIFDRIADYIWVANVPSMVAFSAPKFDPRDASPANAGNRQTFFAYFRDSSGSEISDAHNVLMQHNHVPLVPLNAGSNPVTNQNIDRFVGLTNTQYFLLGQWAAGKFTSGPAEPFPVHPRDAASAGNCVGHPMSPGIEVTWTLRNPVIYESPYRIKHAHDEAYYKEHGLSPDGDETSSWYAQHELPAPEYLVLQDGCEPGDLTKRMSTPWMADFYQCAIQYISFRQPVPATERLVNRNPFNLVPPAPTYYANWWPPQSPVYVITGDMTRESQMAAGVPPGYPVYYARGANNIGNLAIAWSYMGFILNENDSPEGRDYPYFVEKERNHERFVAAAVAVGSPVNQMAASGSYNVATNFFVPAWYLREEAEIADCNGIPDCDAQP